MANAEIAPSFSQMKLVPLEQGSSYGVYRSSGEFGPVGLRPNDRILNISEETRRQEGMYSFRTGIEMGTKSHEVKGRYTLPESNDKAFVITFQGSSDPQDRTGKPSGADVVQDGEFYQQKLKEHGHGMLLFNTAGVGVTYETNSTGDYDSFSLNDRIEEGTQTLLSFISNQLHGEVPNNLVFEGVSMGVHVAIRVLERLDVIARDNTNLNSILAQKIRANLKGLVLIGGAAYLQEIEHLPAKSNTLPEEETRTYLLKHPSDPTFETSPIFNYLDQSQKEGSLPRIIYISGENDTVIPPEVRNRYRQFSNLEDLTEPIKGAGHIVFGRSTGATIRSEVAERELNFLDSISKNTSKKIE